MCVMLCLCGVLSVWAVVYMGFCLCGATSV